MSVKRKVSDKVYEQARQSIMDGLKFLEEHEYLTKPYDKAAIILRLLEADGVLKSR